MDTKRSRFSNLMVIAIAMFFLQFSAYAQKIYQPEKPGSWTIMNGMDACDGKVDKAAFTKNLIAITEWFHQNHPMMKSPKGFDAKVELWNSCHNESHQRPCDYSTYGEVNFNFQLYSIENGREGKWIVEPPHWKIRINSAWSGHGSNFGGLDGFRVQVDDPRLEPALDNAVERISNFFCVFELEKKITSGVRLYKDGSLVVFNPDRPEYWIPVTVKDVVEAKMNYWKIKPEDKMMYDYYLKEYQKLTPEELKSLAYEGSEDGIMDVNGKKEGLQIMQFNPEYWNRSLPKSAVQFMTMNYRLSNEIETKEYFRNNNHPDYPGMFMQKMDVYKLAGLLLRK